MARTDARNGSASAPGPSKPAPAQQLPLFEMSSQFRHWRYSEAGLAKARSDLNATAVQRVRSMLQEEKEVEKQEGHAPTQVAEAPTPSDVEYLTVEDEQSLVTYYLQQLTRLCKMFKFPVNVESTAMTYLKRFYTRNTCMDYHPKNVMLTCLFLSSKTENHIISLDSFTSQIPKCTNEDVLALEFLVSQSLKFEYKCHHADLAGRGIMLDMQTLLANQSEIDHLVEVTYPRAHSTILSLRITDAEFLYTPSQIALAAFYTVDPSLTQKWLASKLDLSSKSTMRKLPVDESTPNMVELIQDIVNPIVTLAEAAKAGKLTDIERVRAVDRRLRFCKNPEKDPNSSLFKKRQREQEMATMNKKVKKEEEIRQRDDVLGDPFE